MNDDRIPESQWTEFCERFTRQHHGWLVGLHQLDTPAVTRVEASAHTPVRLFPDYRPLQEVREGRMDNHVEVMVTVGEGMDEHSFLIEDVVAIFIRRAGDAHQGMRIDSRNGTTTLIEFRTTAEPESLDGLADSER